MCCKAMEWHVMPYDAMQRELMSCKGGESSTSPLGKGPFLPFGERRGLFPMGRARGGAPRVVGLASGKASRHVWALSGTRRYDLCASACKLAARCARGGGGPSHTGVWYRLLATSSNCGTSCLAAGGQDQTRAGGGAPAPHLRRGSLQAALVRG